MCNDNTRCRVTDCFSKYFSWVREPGRDGEAVMPLGRAVDFAQAVGRGAGFSFGDDGLLHGGGSSVLGEEGDSRHPIARQRIEVLRRAEAGAMGAAGMPVLGAAGGRRLAAVGMLAPLGPIRLIPAGSMLAGRVGWAAGFAIGDAPETRLAPPPRPWAP